MNKIVDNLVFEELNENEIEIIKELEVEQNISILSINSIKSEINSKTSKYYVVKYKDIIIAYTNISVIIDVVELNSIVVKKDFKRKNVATFILGNILKVCNENNIERIILEVRVSNIPAQKLYEKFGFKRISIRKKYYPDNLEDAIIYEYLIKPS